MAMATLFSSVAMHRCFPRTPGRVMLLHLLLLCSLETENQQNLNWILTLTGLGLGGLNFAMVWSRFSSSPSSSVLLKHKLNNTPNWSGALEKIGNVRVLFGGWPRTQNLSGTTRRVSNATVTQATLQIDLVPCLTDNYAYLLHDTASGTTGIVDPSAAGPVVKALKQKGLSLDYILNTHHHWDHTGGNAELKKQFSAKVVGPRADEVRIPGIDISLGDGETWMFGEQAMLVLDTPGHTRGHVSFYFKDSKAVFTGDTLFSIGCGRLFEGSPEQMWMSLTKLAALPDDTLVYCGHEYTMSNAKFALTVEPQNDALQSRFEKVKQLRQNGLATIPTTLGEEKETNPFLRPFSKELRKTMKVPATATDIDAFAAVRAAKDRG